MKINMNKDNLTGIILIVIILLGGYFLLNKDGNDSAQGINSLVSEEDFEPINTLNDEEIKTQLEQTLLALMDLHYISVIDKTTTDPNNVIVDELIESMNDFKKLQGVIDKTEDLPNSGNKVIATTGMSIRVSALLLQDAYSNWIEYLRDVDVVAGIDLAEFQYQVATFQSSTHDIYLRLVETAVLLPMVTVEFSEEGEENIIKEDVKNYFLSTIQRLFGGILADNEKFYEETGSRYAVAVLIQGYKDFFNE